MYYSGKFILSIKRQRARNLSKLQFRLRESLKLRCNPLPFPTKFRCPFPVLIFADAPPETTETLLIDRTDPARDTGKLRIPLTLADRALRIT